MGNPDTHRTMAIDQTLITVKNGNQVWLVSAIDTTTKNIRLDVLSEKSGSNLKIFVTNHIIPGSNIVHDDWEGYNFLDDDDSVRTHETHNHCHGDFEWGPHHISYIEAFFQNIA